MCELLRTRTYGRRSLLMAYHFSILFPFVSMILRSTQATGHTARSKALTMLLQGLLLVKQASLSGMGRGVAVVYEEKSFRGQLKKGWCPSIAWMKGLGSVVGRLLLKPVAKDRG